MHRTQILRLLVVAVGCLPAGGLGALDETQVKIVSGTQDTSLALDAKCSPLGPVQMLRPQYAFMQAPVSVETMTRRAAVKLGANTAQQIYIVSAEIRGSDAAVQLAYVRFWNCPE